MHRVGQGKLADDWFGSSFYAEGVALPSPGSAA
jgi:hypothetical protein